ncbi:MAG TPA: Na/Pi symporter [Flavobacterium sp.]|nr:Na/Pi symporter [Flavobacterium sp.]
MLDSIQTIIIILASITLFIYGLQSFSKEIESFGTENLSNWIRKITKVPLGGFLLGSIFTAVIQSSTLVSSITVSLVNTGVITLRDSIMILLGTNIGTTSTAWIVSIQSAFLGPFFIVLGMLISMIPTKISVAGKTIFYFGFIFFSLSYISQAMEPIKNDPFLVEILSKASNPLLGIVYGIIITVVIQSSSVVVGLVIVLLSQGTISIESAIPIVIGANVGTTSTALLVSLKFTSMAKLVALAASAFNVIGVMIIFPFFGLLERIAVNFSDQPAMQVAIAFTISNAFTSLLFLLLINPTIRLLEKHPWYQEKIVEMDT